MFMDMSSKSKGISNTSPKSVTAETHDTQMSVPQQQSNNEDIGVLVNKSQSSIDAATSNTPNIPDTSDTSDTSDTPQTASTQVSSPSQALASDKVDSNASVTTSSSSEEAAVDTKNKPIVSYVPPIKFPRLLGEKAPQDGLGKYTLNAELSVADIAKRRSIVTRILFWLWFALLFVVTIVPYWYGRRLAILHTEEVLRILQFFSLRGIAFLSWLLMTLLIVVLWFSVVPLTRWVRRVMAFTSLALLGCLQFVAGFSLLKSDFWYATYVVYHSFSNFANAVNVGIFCSGLAFFAFIFAYLVISLVVKKRTLPSKQRINIFASTKGILPFTIFLSLQICFICALLFGSFLFQSLR